MADPFRTHRRPRPDAGRPSIVSPSGAPISAPGGRGSQLIDRFGRPIGLGATILHNPSHPVAGQIVAFVPELNPQILAQQPPGMQMFRVTMQCSFAWVLPAGVPIQDLVLIAEGPTEEQLEQMRVAAENAERNGAGPAPGIEPTPDALPSDTPGEKGAGDGEGQATAGAGSGDVPAADDAGGDDRADPGKPPGE